MTISLLKEDIVQLEDISNALTEKCLENVEFKKYVDVEKAEYGTEDFKRDTLIVALDKIILDLNRGSQVYAEYSKKFKFLDLQDQTFDQVSEFDRGRTVAYRDCGLSFREIGSRVGRNQTTVMRICDFWMQEGTTDRRGRSHPPRGATLLEDRQIVHMAVTDHSVTSRTIAKDIESVTHHSVSARNIRRHLQQSDLSARRPLLGLPLNRTTDVSAANGAMKEGCGWQNGMKLSLRTSHASVCNTTMIGFKSGDTVERGC
ncbi:HTH_38 domain-containing protein [Trichonephila clavipes]|uniref:HTH_38 domain-containing protein n=1 Tax=Trichonephila clavipes TaxID=2585209 RepID=A0A8X6V5R8_TRICX|nr:HTH_38 domain-containing protein [Trichonephila clavipes]